MAKSKIKPFPATQSADPNGFEKHYVRIAGSLLKHPQFYALTHTAREVYIYMVFWASGKHEFTFAYGTYKPIVSKGGFQKAVKDLVDKGFITIVQPNKNRRIPNVYAFSAAWKKGKANAPNGAGHG